MNLYIAITKENPVRYAVVVDGKQVSVHSTASEAIRERERIREEAKSTPAKILGRS
jgi:hypothetical protein